MTDPRERTPAFLVAVLIAVIITAGCTPTPTLKEVTRTLESRLGDLELQREEHIRLGRFTLGLAKTLLRFTDQGLDPFERDLIRSVRKIEIATYRVGSPPAPARLADLGRLEAELQRRGWSCALGTRDPGSLTWLMVKQDATGSLRGLLVVELDHHELDVIRVEGRFDRVLADAIADDPAGLIAALEG
jgi:hypothetical protein